MALGSAARAALYGISLDEEGRCEGEDVRESNVEVVVTDDSLEDHGTHASRVGERLVDDVPSVDFALVVTGNVGNVVLEDGTMILIRDCLLKLSRTYVKEAAVHDPLETQLGS